MRSSILAKIPGFRQRIIPEPRVPSRGSQARGTRLACTKRRNVETKRPKRNGRNNRNHRNDRNETTETKQPKRNDRNETAETKRPKRNGRKYKLQEKWKILIKI